MPHKTGELECRGVFLAGARTDRIVDGVVGIRERQLAVHNPGQRIVALNSRPEADGLEERLRCRAERRDGRAAQRIGDADALEGVPLERIAQRDVEAGGRLVVVLRQGLLGLGQVERGAGRGLVILGSVEILLVVVNLESELNGTIADVWLRKAEQ